MPMKIVSTILGIVLLLTGSVSADSPETAAVLDVLSQWNGGTPMLRQAMHETISKHGDADRWSGTTDEMVYGVSVVRFTKRDEEDNDIRLIRGTAHLVAAKEMLFAKVLLDRYETLSMDDPQLLRAALLRASEPLIAKAKLVYKDNTTIVKDYRIVGIVSADRKKMLAVMNDPGSVEAVLAAYAEELHQLARKSLDRGKYEDALQSLHAIRKFGTIGRTVQVDVVRCFLGMNRLEDAEKLVAGLTASDPDDLPFYTLLYGAASREKTEAAQTLMQRLDHEITRINRKRLDLKEFLHPENFVD